MEEYQIIYNKVSNFTSELSSKRLRDILFTYSLFKLYLNPNAASLNFITSIKSITIIIKSFIIIIYNKVSLNHKICNRAVVDVHLNRNVTKRNFHRLLIFHSLFGISKCIFCYYNIA